MKKNIVFLLIAFHCVTIGSIFAQQSPTVTNMLIKKEWNLKIATEYSIKFDNEKICEYLQKSKKEQSELSNYYYLSDQPDRTFKQEKIGKVQNGKYIVSEHKDKTNVYEIIKLTPDSLVLKVCPDPSVLQIGAPSATLFLAKKKRR